MILVSEFWPSFDCKPTIDTERDLTHAEVQGKSTTPNKRGVQQVFCVLNYGIEKRRILPVGKGRSRSPWHSWNSSTGVPVSPRLVLLFYNKRRDQRPRKLSSGVEAQGSEMFKDKVGFWSGERSRD